MHALRHQGGPVGPAGASGLISRQLALLHLEADYANDSAECAGSAELDCRHKLNCYGQLAELTTTTSSR